MESSVDAEQVAHFLLRYLDDNPERVAELTRTLVGFDTTFLGPGTATREEAALQAWVASFLENLGFEIDQWEPDPADFADHPMYMEGLHWKDRPLTVARLPGRGGGRSLILNGHIDTVSAEPVSRWQHDPWKGVREGDRLYGRGACDMKGGIACFLSVLEAAQRQGVRFNGDILVQIVSDEETTGMGTVAAAARGYLADACLVPEPSAFDIWTAFRGILYAQIEVQGRSAHAEIPQPHWREGGGVNAIRLARYVMDGLDRLNEEWRKRGDKLHALLATPEILTTKITGGEFVASIPSACTLEVDITYLPANVDARGFGSAVRSEVEGFLRQWCAAEPWLATQQPTVRWFGDYPAAEGETETDFVRALQDAAKAETIMAQIAGLDSWADAATYLRAGVPAVCFGPGAISRAHTVDEWVSVSELRTCSRVIARFLSSWCGSEKQRL